MATVRCPSCERALEVEEAYRDWTVRCPHCGDEFVPSSVGTDAPAPRRRREEPDDRDNEYEREDDRDDDDDDDDRAWTRAEARQLVAAPAMWLEVVGWLSALGAAGICALCVVLAAAMNNNQNPNPNGNGNDEDEVLLVFMGCCVGVLGVPYSVVMAIGARKMRDLSSRGWAMTACILGVAAFTVFGILGIIHTAFGVWALVILEKPVVRAAFGLEPRERAIRSRRRRRRREWDDGD